MSNSNITVLKPKSESYSVTYYGYKFINNLRCSYQQFTSKYKTNSDEFQAIEIDSGVFIGDISCSYDFENLQKFNITHIISVLAGYKPAFPEHFKYMVIDALDSSYTSLEDTFIRSNNFIKSAKLYNGNVLIHCMMGKSRSVTIASVYLMDKYNFSYEQAINKIKLQKPNINPNIGFIEQLKSFNKTIIQTNINKDNEIKRNRQKIIKQINQIHKKKNMKYQSKQNKKHHQYAQKQHRHFYQ